MACERASVRAWREWIGDCERVTGTEGTDVVCERRVRIPATRISV